MVILCRLCACLVSEGDGLRQHDHRHRSVVDRDEHAPRAVGPGDHDPCGLGWVPRGCVLGADNLSQFPDEPLKVQCSIPVPSWTRTSPVGVNL